MVISLSSSKNPDCLGKKKKRVPVVSQKNKQQLRDYKRSYGHGRNKGFYCTKCSDGKEEGIGLCRRFTEHFVIRIMEFEKNYQKYTFM